MPTLVGILFCGLKCGAMSMIPLSLWLPLSVAACVLLVLIVELLNSGIEAAIDRISLEHHPLSKNAKDMGSAAQLLALGMIASVWAIILLG